MESKRTYVQKTSNTVLNAASLSVSKSGSPSTLNRAGSFSQSDVVKPLPRDRSRADGKSSYKSLSLSPSQPNKHLQRSNSPSPAEHVRKRNVSDYTDLKRQSKMQTAIIKNTVPSITRQRNSSSDRTEKTEAICKLAGQSDVPVLSAGNKRSKSNAVHKRPSRPATVLASSRVFDINESKAVPAGSVIEQHQSESRLPSSDVSLSFNKLSENLSRSFRTEECKDMAVSSSYGTIEESPVNDVNKNAYSRKTNNVSSLENTPAKPAVTVKVKHMESPNICSETFPGCRETVNVTPEILQENDYQTKQRMLSPSARTCEIKAKSEVKKFDMIPRQHTMENCVTYERKVVNLNMSENFTASDTNFVNASDDDMSKTVVIAQISRDQFSMTSDETVARLPAELQGRSRNQQQWPAQLHFSEVADSKQVCTEFYVSMFMHQ